MKQLIALCLLAVLVAAASDDYNKLFHGTTDDFVGKFSLWRPPTWQNYSSCCYIQGGEATYNHVTRQFTFNGVVMGTCAGSLNAPGTNGTWTSSLTRGSYNQRSLSFASSFRVNGAHPFTSQTGFDVTTSNEQGTGYSIGIYTYHNQADGDDRSCDFILRKDTSEQQKKIVSAVASIKSFLSKLHKVSEEFATFTQFADDYDKLFTRTSDDFTGNFSLWRPPTWQNFSTCCYIQGGNAFYNRQSKQIIFNGAIMGTCAGAQNAPGTNGTWISTVTQGNFDQRQLTLSSYFQVQGAHPFQSRTNFQVTTQNEQGLGYSIGTYLYHNLADGSDHSCDFLLRKDAWNQF